MSAEDPQVERGYVKFASELLWAVGLAKLNPTERQIIDCIAWHTYAHGKKTAGITTRQFTEWCVKSKGNVYRYIKRLENDNVILVIKSDNKQIVTYGINKKYKTWKRLSNMITELSKLIPSVIRLDNPLPIIKKHRKHKVSEPPPKNENKETIERVIRYLNAKTGKNFKPTTPETIKLINGRIQENYQPEHFKTVIDKKCQEWLGDPHWEKFLRPNTLFRPSNFESYLNQPAHVPPGESPRTPKAL